MQQHVTAATERGRESIQSGPLVGIAIAVPISVVLWAVILVAVRLAFF